MKIGLIGDTVADVALGGALDGLGAILAQHYETLVASGAAAAALGDLLSDFRLSGGHLVVVVPPASAPPAMGAFQTAVVRRASTQAEYLEALLGDVDALMCCPGGLATLHELHHFLNAAQRAAALHRVLVYLYDRDKYFAPLRLQLQVLVEVGGAPADLEHAIQSFESPQGLRAILQRP